MNSKLIIQNCIPNEFNFKSKPYEENLLFITLDLLKSLFPLISLSESYRNLSVSIE